MNAPEKDSVKWMKAGNLEGSSSAERQSILYATIFFLVLSAVIGVLIHFLS